MDEFRKLTDTEQFAYRQSEIALANLREAIRLLEQAGERRAVSLLKDARLVLVDLVGELDLQAHRRSEAPRGRRASDARRDFPQPSLKDALVLQSYRALAVLKDLDHAMARDLEQVLSQATGEE